MKVSYKNINHSHLIHIVEESIANTERERESDYVSLGQKKNNKSNLNKYLKNDQTESNEDNEEDEDYNYNNDNKSNDN